MNTNLQNLNWLREEKRYFKEYREKAIELWRELLRTWEITEKQMQNSYYQLFIRYKSSNTNISEPHSLSEFN